MKFTLPDLPYGYGDLEPFISKEIMEVHHKKHHKAYVDNLNEAMYKYKKAEEDEDLQTMIQLQQSIKFNGGGHDNHSMFWTSLTPKDQYYEPSGDIDDNIRRFFRNNENLRDIFCDHAAGLQGSGWVWLAMKPKDESLVVTTTSNQDPVTTKGLMPLLGIDVWEHAYYLQYKNEKLRYIQDIWQIINWHDVAVRFAMATG